MFDDTGSTGVATQLDESTGRIDELRAEFRGPDPDVVEISESGLTIVPEPLEEPTEVFRPNPTAFDAERLILDHTLVGLVLRTRRAMTVGLVASRARRCRVLVRPGRFAVGLVPPSAQ